MFLTKLNLKNFRNYSNLTLTFDQKFNIIYGFNGQGKTNIIEGIYYLITSSSFKSVSDSDLIKDELSFFQIKGSIRNEKLKLVDNYEIKYNEQNKSIIINNTKSNFKKKEHSTKLILFFPDDIEIIKSTPKIRRKYLDDSLSLMNDNYKNIFQEYKKLNKMRNDYLKKLQLNQLIDEKYFEILNNYYIKRGSLLIQLREKFINKINEFCEEIYFQMTGSHFFQINYLTEMYKNLNLEKLEEDFKIKLIDNFEQEKKLGKSLIGPHLDDLLFELDKKDLKIYGSQGQQRMAIIALKLANLKIYNKYQNEYPIILIDDIFGELDKIKRKKLIEYFDTNHQIIITTADLKVIPHNIRKQANLIEIKNGKILENKEV